MNAPSVNIGRSMRTVPRPHRPLGVGFWFGTSWLAALVFAAVTASWLPIDPNAFDPSNGLRAPNWSHPFGTTRLGEDVLAICIHGSRVALIVGLGAAGFALVVGGPIGMASGYFRGFTDRAVTTLLDAVMAIPGLVLALALVLFIGQTMMTIVFIVGLLFVPSFVRVVRAATMAVADREFVVAARLTGARHRRILLREIGPNVAVPLAGYLFLIAGFAILLEGGLSFVGLGVPYDKASWGRLIVSGRDELQRAWWWSLCPAGVFFLTLLSLSLVQEGLQARWLGRPRRVRPGGRRRSPMQSAVPVPGPSAGQSVGEVALRASGQSAVSRPAADPVPSRVGEAAALESAPRDCAPLEVVDLHVHLSTPYGIVRAVDGVNLTIRRGEMLAVVGESGAGKTMLARSILGIESPIAAVTGRVLLDGIDLRTLAPQQFRRHRGRDIAIVLQDPMTSLDPVMRVGRQIAELARVHLHMSRLEARRHAVQLLSEVGIAEPERRSRQYPQELSGGIRQRVAIALALSCHPKVLIADEPTSALDVVVQAQILDLIDRLRHDRNLAVLLITHDLPLALARADRVAVMYAGRIVEQATPAQMATGLRMPYASALFAAAPQLSAPSHQRTVPIPGRSAVITADSLGCAFAPRCERALVRCALDTPMLEPLAHGPGGAPVVGERLVACWSPVDVSPRRGANGIASTAGTSVLGLQDSRVPSSARVPT